MGKNAEQKLKENSDLLQAVFDSAPNGIAVMQTMYDEKGRVEDFAILLFNAYTLNWIGDTDYKGKRYSDVFPMVKETGILDKFIEVAETGTAANFETWYTGEGMKHWFRFTAVKQDELLVVTTEDITAAKKAEEALRKSEEFNRTALESSPDCVKVMDTEGRLTYMSYNGTCIMEIDDFNTVKNKAWWELWPDDSKEYIKDAIAKALKGQTVQFQAFCPTAKGTPKWWDVVVSPIASNDGLVSQLISVSRDITERKKVAEALKESEENLRTMVLDAPVGMCVIDASSLVSEIANESFVEVAGKPHEAIVGHMYWDTFAEAKPYYEAALQEVINQGVPFYANEVELMLIRHGKEEILYVTFVYLPMKNSEGTVNKVAIYVLENTPQVVARRQVEELVTQRTRELAEANETLHDINKELQRSNQNLEEFAHAASHDLKEPIRKIHFFTNQLKGQLNSYLKEAEVRSFGRIENATERMGTLIDDLLIYSHVSQRPHEMDSVDLNVKVQRVLDDLELDILEKAAVINVGKLPVVKGHRRQLQQLFQNLISNALKYSRADVPPQIEITAEPHEQEGKQYHLIRVTDNGIGFAQKYAEKIFQMFARLHGRAEYSGTGVGLSIVKKVVENHHGHIRAEGVPGQGSTFSVLLPAE